MKLHLSRFIGSTQGRYLMSILLGFGLATLFRASCEGSDCIIRVAPPSESLQPSAIYSWNGQCHSFKKKAISCSKDESKIIPSI
jgi:hypothetical protein